MSAEYVRDEEYAVGLALVFEPMMQALPALEFRCLVKRVVDRLDKNGWRLIDGDAGDGKLA